MAADGHLDCMFNCGLRFSDLETLYLHIELDHREDNSVSPFAIQEVADRPPAQPNAYADEYAPPLPARNLPHKHSHSQPNGSLAGPSGQNSQARSTHHGGPYEGKRNVDETEDTFVQCPEKDCEELVLVSDLNDHLDFHDAQQASLDEDSLLKPSLPARLNGHSSSSSSSRFSKAESSASPVREGTKTPDGTRTPRDTGDEGERVSAGRRFLSKFKTDMLTSRDRVPSNKACGNAQRLGKAELGPYAYEPQMPSSMMKKLREGPKITKTRRISRNGGLVTHEQVEGQTNGVMPILRQLIDLDPAVYKAYLCHPSVTHVGKRAWETGFCGYHNTQMAISYIQNSKHPAHTLFPGYIPGVLDVQDWIETAWDEGINSHARAEFGGLRNTRKWIGTLEVDTLLQYMGIPHQIHQFHDTLEVNNQYADQNLLDWVEDYFKDAAINDRNKVKCTLKPPIYFQRPGHSLTIVGIERTKDGKRNLLVLDPMYAVPTAMLQLIERGRVRDTSEKLLRLYRRNQNRLYNFADFEAITLEGELPLFPAWDILARACDNIDQFVVVTDWQWKMHSLAEFSPCLPWHLYGSVFRTTEARFLPPPVSTILSLCVPQVYFAGSATAVAGFEQWRLPHATYESCTLLKAPAKDDEKVEIIELQDTFMSEVRLEPKEVRIDSAVASPAHN